MGEVCIVKVEPRWLRLKDAALYAGMGVKRLRGLCERGEVRSFQDPEVRRGGCNGEWVVDRDSIDEYRLSQVSDHVISESDIRKRLGLGRTS